MHLEGIVRQGAEQRSGKVQIGVSDDLLTPVSECTLCIPEALDYFDEDEDGYLSEDSLDPDDMTYEVCCCLLQAGQSREILYQADVPATAAGAQQ